MPGSEQTLKALLQEQRTS